MRDPWELVEDGRIPGARSLPLSELGFHLDELRRDGPVVLSCRSGARSLTAARTLAYLGVLKAPTTTPPPCTFTSAPNVSATN